LSTVSDNTISSVWTLVKRLGIAALIIFLLYSIRVVVGAVLAAVLVAYIAMPLVDYLCSGRIAGIHPKTQRLVATVLVFLLLLSALVVTVAYIISPLTREVSEFSSRSGYYFQRMEAYLSDFLNWYQASVPQEVKDAIGRFDYSAVAGWISTYTKHVLGFVTSGIGILMEFVLIPVLAFYFVLDHRSLTHEFCGIAPRRMWRDLLRMGRRVGGILQSYIFGQLILCFIAGVVTTGFLALMGMPYLVVLGLIAAITRAIPVVGPALSGIPIILVGLLTTSDIAVPLILLGFTVVLHFAESKFLMPYLIGERLQLNPAVVIIVLLVGAEFWGFLGMFLAAPVAAVVRELIRYYYIEPTGSGRRGHTLRSAHQK
jgi:predicted PurR-regulated permease PerM